MQPLEISYRALLPEMITSGAGITIMLADALFERARRRAGLIALFGLLAAAASALSLRGQPRAAFSGMIVADQFRIFFALVLLLATLLVVLISLKWIEEEALPQGEYFALLMFAVTGMLLMSAAGDLVMIFLGLELSSIATYALCGYRRRDPRSNESAVKYFILGSFSTAFLLYGIALIYGASYDPSASPAATTNLQLLRERFAQGRIFSEQMLLAGAAMMIVGFGFKVATAPFHIWSPDVYEGAPTPVTALLSTGSKAAAFSAFLRVFVLTFQVAQLESASTNVLAAMAALTMTLGNLIAIVQNNVKRMLAYSSIAHAGYALVGMVAGDWRSVAFYMLSYSVINIGAFAVVGVIARRGDRLTNIGDYGGIGFRALGLASALSLFLLSLAGVPLTAGFMGKLLVFKSAWGAGFHGLVIIGVINSAISWYYYLRVIVVMFFYEPRSDFKAEAAPPLAAALALMVLATFYLGVAPGRVLAALERARDQIAAISP
jgi:NADH-quinone oxidoreductase subunit N